MQVPKFPEHKALKELPTSKVEQVLAAYVSTFSHILRLDTLRFLRLVNDRPVGLVEFVCAYVSGIERCLVDQREPVQSSELDSKVFLVLERAWTQRDCPRQWLDYGFLCVCGSVFSREFYVTLRTVYPRVWHLHRDTVARELGTFIARLPDELENPCTTHALAVTIPLHLCFEMLEPLFSGYEAVLSGLNTAFARNPEPLVVMLAYNYLVSMMREQLMDWLVSAMGFLIQRYTSTSDLLHALCRRTLLIPKLTDAGCTIDKRIDMARLKEIASSNPPHDEDSYDMKAAEIRDIFPDMPISDVLDALRLHRGNTEAAISAILEGSLPTASGSATQRTVFDGDEFDRLQIDPSRVSRGKESAKTADDLLNDRDFARQNRAKILALAHMDDDDEYDDTYDYDDAGKPNTASDDGDEDSAPAHSKDFTDSVLYIAFTTNPGVLSREKAVRKSADRVDLRARTGLSDEQIEGWKIMLDRNPKMITQLEGLYGFKGNEKGMGPVSSRAKSTLKANGARQQDANQNRARKEKHKATQANHSRKAGRAKKMNL